MTILVLIGTVFVIIWEIFHGRISLNSVLLQLLVSGFWEWIQIGADVYILHQKYQVKPHPFPWSSAPCTAAIVHRNHFFYLYQKDKSSESKLNFRQANDRCERVLEAANLHKLIKQNSPSLPRNLALRTFGELPVVFSTKVNLLYLLYSRAWRCFLLHLIKQNCLLKTFLRTLILMTQVSLYLFFFLDLIWNCIIFL